jgi:hypothetical protein
VILPGDLVWLDTPGFVWLMKALSFSHVGHKVVRGDVGLVVCVKQLPSEFGDKQQLFIAFGDRVGWVCSAYVAPAGAA